MQTIIGKCGDIVLGEHLSTNVYQVTRNGQKEIMKIINEYNHPWKNLPSFHDVFGDNDLIHRMECIYKLFNDLGLSRVTDIVRCRDSLLVFMPIFTPNTKEKLTKNSKEIEMLIQKMHDDGIIHGDLHGGNIMYDINGKPVIIDLETVFFENEWGVNPVTKEWLSTGFDMENLKEFITMESFDNWKLIPE